MNEPTDYRPDYDSLWRTRPVVIAAVLAVLLAVLAVVVMA